MIKLIALLIPFCVAAAPQTAITISNGQLTVKTCTHDAGAVCSVTLRGAEYIDDYDHGRQLQSASSFSGLGEAFNPTEAGSELDGVNPSRSTSRLIASWRTADTLATYSQMAFWRPVNGAYISQHTLNKRVAVLPGNKIEYSAQFNVPAGESHSSATFEVLTGYMPENFSMFWTYNPVTQSIGALSDGPGEQSLPVIFATPDGQHAMGAWSPELPQAAWPTAGYGRWRFTPERVVKWNTVYRYANPSGSYHFRVYVFVGTFGEVVESMRSATNGH
jgi:hypothetical protein